MIKNLKMKKILLTVLFILLLLSGVAAAGMNFTNSAFAEGAKVEVVGAFVRYPKANESVPEGTGLRFEVKLSGVEIANVQNLGVLVDLDGVPTIELTGDKHVKYIENGVTSKENSYVEESAGVYTMRVSLVNVPINHFHHEFVCRAYYQVKGGEVVYSDTVKRSATYVIKNAIEDTSEGALTSEQKKTLENLRNASKDHTYATYGDVIETPTESKQGTRKAFCACGTESATPIGLYHYVFDTNGGETLEPQDGYSYDTIVLPNPVRSGAEFLGWYNESDEKVEQVVVPYESDVTGKTVTLKAKWRVYLTEEELAAGYSFDSVEKIGRVKANSADTVISYDETKNAMAIAQGGKDESRLVRFSALISLKKGDRVFYNIDSYNTTNNGGSLRIMYANDAKAVGHEIKHGAASIGFGYTFWEAEKDYTDVYLGYINYVNTAYYLRSVQVVKARTTQAQKLTAAQLEEGFAFDNAEKVDAYTACDAQVSALYDGTQNAMKVMHVGANRGVSLNIDAFELNVGDTIKIIAYSNFNTCIQINGKWVLGTYKTSAKGFSEYTWTVPETHKNLTITDGKLAVSGMKFYTYTGSSGAWYIQSIKIVRANAN